MKIDIESQMLKAFRDGTDSYVPIVAGIELEPEGGFVEVSLRNLRVLVKQGFQVERLIVGPNSNVLVEFSGGKYYLATGFAVGYAGSEVLGLAEFASEVGFGRSDILYERLAAYPEDFEGELQFIDLEDEGLKVI